MAKPLLVGINPRAAVERALALSRTLMDKVPDPAPESTIPHLHRGK